MSTFHVPPLADPSAAYRDYEKLRQLTLGDLLLENRIIFLVGPITDENPAGSPAKLVMQALASLRGTAEAAVSTYAADGVYHLAVSSNAGAAPEDSHRRIRRIQR